MPLSTDSEEWNDSRAVDRLTTNIGDGLLLQNKNEAYSVKEIAMWISENYPENIPPQIRESEGDEALISLVAAVMDRLDRRRKADCRFIEKDGRGEMYYTYSDEDGSYPTVRIRHDIKPRLDDIEDEISDLKDSVHWLDNQIR